MPTSRSVQPSQQLWRQATCFPYFWGLRNGVPLDSPLVSNQIWCWKWEKKGEIDRREYQKTETEISKVHGTEMGYGLKSASASNFNKEKTMVHVSLYRNYEKTFGKPWRPYEKELLDAELRLVWEYGPASNVKFHEEAHNKRNYNWIPSSNRTCRSLLTSDVVVP